ncbi:energy transducer TonB [Stakelama pacifica]|uniref:Protein TonB n=1 Tax=Stakelama pacifica TaxID=517720 RepID=A0A4R6FBZ4_9SPHN|nr:energy transducer TonB [Stakelama pacifica]TDN77764.1 protein TonB [Stakelama pacifica]GGP00839.1 hypothetical protein GCM10011329_37640 [Stakelama pacifica]
MLLALEDGRHGTHVDTGSRLRETVSTRRPVMGKVAGATVRSRYRQRTLDGRAIAIVAAIHVALGVAVLTTRMEFRQPEPHADLTTFDVAPPTPPRPIPPEPQPQNAAPQVVEAPVVAPDPLVRTPQPPPAIRTVSTPPKTQPAIFSPVTVSAPPAPPAPPAPVTPPSFDAAQLDNPAPRYPFLSRKAHEEGVVMLRVLVSPDGSAKTLQVDRTSGSKRLDDAALSTVRRWKFVAATQAGKAIEAWVLVPVKFSLG